MKLTEHFSEEELGVAGLDPRFHANAAFLCMNILEPIRLHYGKPLRIHDGYRSPVHNASVGGKVKSFHLFEGGQSAADFDIPDIPLTELFSWIRLASKLPFDKVILEHSDLDTPRCIHVQVDMDAVPRRQAFLGSVGAANDYVQVEVV